MSEQFEKKVIEQNVFEEQRRKKRNEVYAQLQELERRRKNKSIRWLCVLVPVIMAALTIFSNYYDSGEFDLVFVAFAGILSAIFAGFVFLYFNLILEMRENKLRRALLELDAAYAQNDVEEDIFENSIKMSYKYLDQYYLQTREQAQRGFFVTISVAIFGALLIGGGIIAMFFGVTEPSYITCATGVITEFIAAVFFYLYNRTVSSMSKYHNKLVLSQNISIALKVSDSLPDNEKLKTKNLIVAELLKDINRYLIREETNTDSK